MPGTPTTPRPRLGAGKIFDEEALEGSNGVAKILATYGITEVLSVDCPAEQEVKQGTTFSCTVKIRDEPAEQVVEIRVLDDQGAYEVGLPRSK